jgi:WD40 repeat protein
LEEGASGRHMVLNTLMGHEGPVNCLAVCNDREENDNAPRRWILCSGGQDSMLKIWLVAHVSTHVIYFG